MELLKFYIVIFCITAMVVLMLNLSIFEKNTFYTGDNNNNVDYFQT